MIDETSPEVGGVLHRSHFEEVESGSRAKAVRMKQWYLYMGALRGTAQGERNDTVAGNIDEAGTPRSPGSSGTNFRLTAPHTRCCGHVTLLLTFHCVLLPLHNGMVDCS